DCHQEKKNNATHQKFIQYTAISHQQCNDCHKNPHTKPLDSRCKDCHQVEGWKGKQLLFEHQKSSFPLRGQHQEVHCIECHKPVQSEQKEQKEQKELIEYALGKKACQDCHEDAHHGEVQKNCTQCHLENRWSEIVNFQHNKDSKFALKAKHQEVNCTKCHRRENATGEKELHLAQFNFSGCQSCHSDPHQGQMKKSCDSCHTEQGWIGREILFKHNRDSSFKLVGVHQQVSCEACHKKQENTVVQYAGLPAKNCNDCHQDPHQGQMSKSCQTCHTEKSWAGNHLSFIHNRDSRFQLTGVHQLLKCQECHKPEKQGVRYVGIQSSQCSNCHEDVHREQLGNSCTRCHTTNGWKGDFLLFQHQKTRFPLGVDHQKLACQECHTQKNLFAILEISCRSCHNDYNQILEGTYLTKSLVPSVHRILNCEQCHQDQEQSSLKDPEKQCVQCHSIHYERLYFDWKLSINKLLREASGTSRNDKELELISKVGTHNFKLIQQLLQEASTTPKK
ncbi:MAG: cytochrome c3 family protein, partial [Planctomycetota bacterium]